MSGPLVAFVELTIGKALPYHQPQKARPLSDTLRRFVQVFLFYALGSGEEEGSALVAADFMLSFALTFFLLNPHLIFFLALPRAFLPSYLWRARFFAITSSGFVATLGAAYFCLLTNHGSLEVLSSMHSSAIWVFSSLYVLFCYRKKWVQFREAAAPGDQMHWLLLFSSVLFDVGVRLLFVCTVVFSGSLRPDLLYNAVFLGVLVWYWAVYSAESDEDTFCEVFRRDRYGVVVLYAVLKALKNFSLYSSNGMDGMNLLWWDLVVVGFVQCFFLFHEDFGLWRGGTHLVFVVGLTAACLGQLSRNWKHLHLILNLPPMFFAAILVLFGLAFIYSNYWTEWARNRDVKNRMESIRKRAANDPWRVLCSNGKFLSFASELALLTATL